MDTGEARLISHAAMAMLRNSIGNGLPADPGNGRLARRINVGDNNAIGLIESSAKFLPQRLGSGVAMGLKHCQHAIAPRRTRRGEGGPNFCWMMRVIIDQQKTVAGRFDFETPARLPKFAQGFGNLLERNTELRCQCDDPDGVLDIVPAVNTQSRS